MDLGDVLARVTLDVENTGDMDAPEVVQLYRHIDGVPKRQLRGFEKPLVQAGSSISAISVDPARPEYAAERSVRSLCRIKQPLSTIARHIQLWLVKLENLHGR